jgi:ferredoxin
VNEAEFTTCAFCPRLCRHVCPVAVATGLEAATATAMMSAPLLQAQGVFTAADALAGTSLCLGCGACTAHCKVHVPVAARLSGFRAEAGAVSVAEALRPIDGAAVLVCVLTGPDDWSAAWAVGRPVARLRTGDSLGHTAWKHGASGVLAALTAHLRGREVVTGSGAVAEIAAAAGIVVHALPTPAAPLEFHTCYAGPRPGAGQLACCGRRDGFPDREPEAARLVAVENVRLLGGNPVACADEECACWLRAHGAAVVGPLEPLLAPGASHGR